MFLLVFSTLSLLVWFGVGVLGSALGLVVLDSGRDVGGGGVQGEQPEAGLGAGDGRLGGGDAAGRSISWPAGQLDQGGGLQGDRGKVVGEGEVGDDGRKVTVVLGGKEVDDRGGVGGGYVRAEACPGTFKPLLHAPPDHLILLSGLPGAGKSSTGAHLAPHHGHVYY